VVAALLELACAQPEPFQHLAGGGDAGNPLIPQLVGGIDDDAGASTDGGGATSGTGGNGDSGANDGSGGAAGAAPMMNADDASSDRVAPDGGVEADDGGPGPMADAGAGDAAPDPDPTPDAHDADGAASMDVASAEVVGGDTDAAPNTDVGSGASDASDAGAGLPDAGVEAPSSSAAVCINSGGPAVEPCRADFGFAGGSARSHQATVDLSRVTDPAPAAVYETARTGSFVYAVNGFAPGSEHLVRLHFVETYVTGKGQRVCDVTSGAVAVLTRFDIFATAGGANIVTIQERQLTADSSGSIVLAFARVTGSCLVSAIEVR
jgi:hypothetical protein